RLRPEHPREMELRNANRGGDVFGPVLGPRRGRHDLLHRRGECLGSASNWGGPPSSTTSRRTLKSTYRGVTPRAAQPPGRRERRAPLGASTPPAPPPPAPRR